MIVVEHHCYQPPKPSRAMRPFARKTPNHFVGELTFGEEKGQGQTLGFGSKLEHDIALISIYRPGVIDVCEQVEVSFIKSDGKVARHYIDYIVTEEGQFRTAVLVKKKYVADGAKFQDIAARVALAAIPSVADKVVIATEDILERNLLMRVEQFHSCRFAQPFFDQRLSASLDQIEGETTIREFLGKSGIGYEGFHGVIRLIRFGKIKALAPGLLTLSSPIGLGSI